MINQNNTDFNRSKLIKTSPDAYLPQRQTLYSIGYDLHSINSIVVYPGQTVKVSTGYKLELYKNDKTGEVHYADIRGRSGLYAKGIIIAPGLIDPDYDGDLIVIITNTAETEFKIAHGDRIAQLIIYVYNILSTQLLDEEGKLIQPKNTIRIAGFGSTGR